MVRLRFGAVGPIPTLPLTVRPALARAARLAALQLSAGQLACATPSFLRVSVLIVSSLPSTTPACLRSELSIGPSPVLVRVTFARRSVVLLSAGALVEKLSRGDSVTRVLPGPPASVVGSDCCSS